MTKTNVEGLWGRFLVTLWASKKENVFTIFSYGYLTYVCYKAIAPSLGPILGRGVRGDLML